MESNVKKKINYIQQRQFLVSVRLVKDNQHLSECYEWMCLCMRVQGPPEVIMPGIQWQKRGPVTHTFIQWENRSFEWLTPAAHWSAEGTLLKYSRKMESADISFNSQWHFTASLDPADHHLTRFDLRDLHMDTVVLTATTHVLYSSHSIWNSRAARYWSKPENCASNMIIGCCKAHMFRSYAIC